MLDGFVVFDLAHNVIIGQGETAIATARYLLHERHTFEVLSSQENRLPKDIRAHYTNQISKCSLAWVSPGIQPGSAILEQVKDAQQILDIDYFLTHTQSNVILVTGTNGKSTVCVYLQQMLLSLGFTCDVYGNYKPGLLHALQQKLDWVILELSSFQLYRMMSGHQVAGVLLLHIKLDHLDWHTSESEYRRCKEKVLSYSNTQVGEGHFGEISYLSHVQALSKRGHDMQTARNIAAAQTMLRTLNLPTPDVSPVYLPYRRSIRSVSDKVLINDSKSTNVASTLSALEYTYSTYPSQPVLLILAGICKSGAFSDLINMLTPETQIIVVGDDFKELEVPHQIRVKRLSFIKEIVTMFSGVVLFSPAGSSYDQYTSYAERGRDFDAITGSIA